MLGYITASLPSARSPCLYRATRTFLRRRDYVEALSRENEEGGWELVAQ